jgi:P-type E1-E2 ATPase
MFQIVSVVVWLLEAYYYFCTAIIIMILAAIISELLLTKRHLEETRVMALYTCNVKVHRKGEVKTISSEELVPGDVFEVPLAKRMPCDAVIISGSCMVNESMLTGESMPILKSPIPNNNSLYNPEVNTLCSLYEGTEVTDF